MIKSQNQEGRMNKSDFRIQISELKNDLSDLVGSAFGLLHVARKAEGRRQIEEFRFESDRRCLKSEI